jgi:hypothetical protein
MPNAKSSRTIFLRQSRFFIECGITTSEEEFLVHIVLPNGKGTVGDWLMPQIDKAYESGRMPPLLTGW